MIDVFSFFNELDLLEVRLHALAPYVDRFVLAESTQTHSGNPKPLFFEENKDRFKDFNITHLIIPPKDGLMWELEEYAREYLLDNIKDGNPEEIILISDVDEIPNIKNYNGEEGSFKQYLYRYYFNCYTGFDNWIGTFAIKRKNVDRNCIEFEKRKRYKKKLKVVGDGWHFSSLGSPEDIIYKFESSADQRFNKEKYKSVVEERRKNLTCYFDSRVKFSAEMPSGPEWLLNNKEKYPNLFVKEI